MIIFSLMIIVWITYGYISIAVSKLELNNDILIIFWLSFGRLIGNILSLLIMGYFNEKKKIVFDLTSIGLIILPLIGNTGWLFYFKLLMNGEMSVISPFMNLYIIFPIMIATKIKKKKFTKLKVSGIILGIVSGILLNINFDVSGLIWHLQIIYFIIVSFCWGFVDTVSAIFDENKITLMNIMFFNSIGQLIYLVGTGIYLLSFDKIQNPSNFYNFIIGNICLSFGWLIYIILCRINASIITALMALNFMLPVFYGIFVDNENVTVIKISSLILAFITIIILQISAYKEENQNIEI